MIGLSWSYTIRNLHYNAPNAKVMPVVQGNVVNIFLILSSWWYCHQSLPSWLSMYFRFQLMKGTIFLSILQVKSSLHLKCRLLKGFTCQGVWWKCCSQNFLHFPCHTAFICWFLLFEGSCFLYSCNTVISFSTD